MRYITGAALPTMSAFLVLRGLKRTLTLRMEWHSTTALAIAQVRDGHSAVGWVISPSSTRIPIRRLPESRCRASPTLTARVALTNRSRVLKKAPAKSAMAS
ncbi:PLP-dependent transferase [Mesorhizobium sp. NZP2298]|uniref:PLP-dependent transferase n=1 Tax=Mesorhizobium sp. NZP2298 TaxID=2483403 RepID=UPI001FEFBBEC|nr:PLP-dependent transferase [Mesorhizobium sp. NZP2298]